MTKVNSRQIRGFILMILVVAINRTPLKLAGPILA